MHCMIPLTRYRLLAFVVLLATTAMTQLHAQAAELSREERSQAVTSLREYQSVFARNRVVFNVHVSATLGQGFPERRDFMIVAEEGKMFTNQFVGASLDLFSSGVNGLGGLSARTNFDFQEHSGYQVTVQADGTITQVKKVCEPVGVMRFSGMRLAEALGWLHHYRERERNHLVDGADFLESAAVVRRIRTDRGETLIVATSPVSERAFRELHYTDLPDVRLVSRAHIVPGSSEIRARISYQAQDDGLMVPRGFRETNARVEDRANGGPLVIQSSEDAVVTGFSITPIDEAAPFPTIEIPDGIKIIDDCVKQQKESSVAAPTPEPNR